MFKLTKSKLRILAQICVNFSAVCFASLVVPVFVGQFDISEWPVVLFGIIITLGLSLSALFFAEKGKL